MNILDLRVPGGRPFREFGGSGIPALVTGTEQVARFQAGREAEALAAQELAEIAAERKVAEARTAMVAEQEAKLRASDEAIFPLLGESSEHLVKVTTEGRRVEGMLRITERGASHASGLLCAALGNGEFYETKFAITASGEPGLVVARYPGMFGFQGPGRRDCMIRGVFSAELGILFFEGDPEDPQHSTNCGTDRFVIDLGGAG